MVEGLSVFVVHCYAQIAELIDKGTAARTTAATRMNEESSRSHRCACGILVEGEIVWHF
jgi:Kinesin-like protein